MRKAKCYTKQKCQKCTLALLVFHWTSYYLIINSSSSHNLHFGKILPTSQFRYRLLKTGLVSALGGTGFTRLPTKQAQLRPKTSWTHPGSVWSQ